jgi:glycosyltransferase involved in cell wall biosynthesis
MTTVTTIIPVRNRAQLIVRALESVSAQTCPPTEIIVVDDASTDDTPLIVETLAKKMSNLVLIKLIANVGAAKARNIGAEAAKGDLLAFLDSDDRWYPEKTERQIKEFRAHQGVVAVFSGYVETNGESSSRRLPPAEASPATLYRGCSDLSTCTLMLPKKTFVEIGGFDIALPSCQDWDLFIRLAEIGKFLVIQEELAEVFTDTGNRISNNKAAVLLGHDILFRKIYDKIPDPALVRIVRGEHQRILAEIFSSEIFEPRRALGHAWKALLTAPSVAKLRVLVKVTGRVAQGQRPRLQKPFA